MPLDFTRLGAKDKVPYPGCDEDEYIEIRSVKGYLKDTELQVAAVEEDPETGERAYNGAKHNLELMRHMITDAHVKKPKGGFYRFDDAFFLDMVNLLGDWLMKEINKRGYSLAPRIPEGKRDADGQPLTFPHTDEVRTG